jgi:diguanylate cyclase (GGDEF)-like protein
MSFLRPDSIRNKMLVFAVLATLVPSVTTAWVSYVQNKQALRAKASEELLGASAQAVRELDLWTKERRYDLRVFSISYEVTENLERIPQVRGEPTRSGRAHGRLTEYLASVRERFVDYSELLVVDMHGHVVASSDPTPGPVTLPARWATELPITEWVLGQPYWDSTRHRAEMVVAVPIRSGGGGRLLGALTARLDLGTVADTLRRFSPGEGGQIYIMTQGGGLIVSSRGSSDGLMRQGFAPRDARWLLDREGRAVQYSNSSGDRVLGSARWMVSPEWVVVAEIPAAEAFAQVARLRDVTVMIVALLLAVVGALAYLLSLMIVRPLDRLTEGAANVAKGDLDVGLPVTTGGEVGYLTSVFNNMVTRLRESRTELERLSVTDPLTGLFNRRRLIEALEHEVRRSHRLSHPFTVLMADVDLFKHYNDAYGHPAGDGVLKRVAAIMREASRDVDLVARYGGEEFMIVMPETRTAGAIDVGERIRARLAAERLPEGSVTMSVGVAEFPMHGDSAEGLIAAADAAMYQAKRAGRDRVVVANGRAPVPAA